MIDVIAATSKRRLFAHCIGEMHFWNVTGCAAYVGEQLTPFVDARFGCRVRGGDEAELGEAVQFCGNRLRRVVNRHCRDVADGKLARYTVAIGIGSRFLPEPPD